MDDSQLQQIEEAAAEIAMGAGALLLRYFKGPLDVAYKADDKRNPVTDADHASDEYIRGEIVRRFPDHGIVSEEMEAAPEDAPDIAWIIDPLDGTTNFLHGVPVFGACIGVLERGAPVAAAMTLDAAAWSCSNGTHALAASLKAFKTSVGIGAPPSRVTEPDALIIGVTPNSS